MKRRRSARMMLCATAALGALLTIWLARGREPRLRLEFELVAELPFSLATGLAFFPDDSKELLVVGRDGDFAHMALSDDGLEVITRGRIDGLHVEHAGATGVLGLALDPDFSENRLFYIAVTLARERTAVHRHTLYAGDGAATLASQVRTLDLAARGAPRWHNIMAMGFDDESLMWVMVGDKGLFDPAQDPTSFLGSMIRIDPVREPGRGGYRTIEGLPVHSPGAHPGVFAIGIRSPWRGLYHRGRWFFGDVGDRFEEINVVARTGMNFGWPHVEGPCALDDQWDGDCDRYDDPWEFYDRSSSHRFVVEDAEAVPTSSRSVYVGWIYEPNDVDPYNGRFDNVLTFGDTYVGFVRGKRIDGDQPSWHVGHLQWASAWGQGSDGCVYVATLGEWPPSSGEEGRASRLYRAVLKRD